MSDSDKKIIDISAPLFEGVPVWPKSTGIKVSWTRRVERKEGSNLTRLDTDVHIGTHVEGPIHSFTEGTPVDQLPLDILLGPAVVVHLPQAAAIGKAELDQSGIPSGTVRLLFRTRNSDLHYYEEGKFREDFVGLTPEGAQWCADRGIKLVGMDYLSIGRYGGGPAVHDILFKAGVVVVEGLILTDAPAGQYSLICLPLKLIGREGAPARAILRPMKK